MEKHKKPLTPEERADDILVMISGMTFSPDDGAEGWREKVRPVIVRAIREAEEQAKTDEWVWQAKNEWVWVEETSTSTSEKTHRFK